MTGELLETKWQENKWSSCCRQQDKMEHTQPSSVEQLELGKGGGRLTIASTS